VLSNSGGAWIIVGRRTAHPGGEALGAESRAAGVGVLLGPGVNIKRSPLCGRNFEYLSEDPVISGRLGAALVRGIQAMGVGASVKHFAANNQETGRMQVSAEVDERTLREIYLAGFEHVVTTAAPWTVMAAYNKINGVHAAHNGWLLTEVLGRSGDSTAWWCRTGARSGIPWPRSSPAWTWKCRRRAAPVRRGSPRQSKPAVSKKRSSPGSCAPAQAAGSRGNRSRAGRRRRLCLSPCLGQAGRR
jgi:Glycosyl hydrolase family 3 N terminal domain